MTTSGGKLSSGTPLKPLLVAMSEKNTILDESTLPDVRSTGSAAHTTDVHPTSPLVRYLLTTKITIN